jgi:hypothetical protein
MHIEGIMYEADYPYTLGVHGTQQYDAGKLAPIAVSEPFAICTEGTIGARINCSEDYIAKRAMASTICLTMFDLLFPMLDVGHTEQCTEVMNSIAFLFTTWTAPRVMAIYFQNSSGLDWCDRGMGRYIISNYEREHNMDARSMIANLLSVNVTRANHTASSSTDSDSPSTPSSSGASSNTSESASASSYESSVVDDSSDSVKNEVAHIAPFALLFLATALVQ